MYQLSHCVFGAPNRGTQYASAIFYHNEAQKAAATKVKEDLSSLLKAGKVEFKGRKFEGDAVTTAIVPATECMFLPRYLMNDGFRRSGVWG